MYLIEISFISGIVAVIKWLFAELHTSYIILLVLILIDTFTGMAVAFKYGRFNSKGLCKLFKKTITYTTAIITVRLLELGILDLVETNFVSLILAAFLQITETISILENLTLLGVPLPSNFITFLLKHIKIPGLTDFIKIGRNDQKDISEIDDIIRHQVPTFRDENIRKLLKIKFEFWKTIYMQVNKIFTENNIKSAHLYLKMMSLIEVELKDMKGDIKEENIPNKYIDKFEENYRPKVNRWLQQVKKKCYSEQSNEEKRKEIIDSIIILCYEIILNTHRIFDK